MNSWLLLIASLSLLNLHIIYCLQLSKTQSIAFLDTSDRHFSLLKFIRKKRAIEQPLNSQWWNMGETSVNPQPTVDRGGFGRFAAILVPKIYPSEAAAASFSLTNPQPQILASVQPSLYQIQASPLTSSAFSDSNWRKVGKLSESGSQKAWRFGPYQTQQQTALAVHKPVQSGLNWNWQPQVVPPWSNPAQSSAVNNWHWSPVIVQIPAPPAPPAPATLTVLNPLSQVSSCESPVAPIPGSYSTIPTFANSALNSLNQDSRTSVSGQVGSQVVYSRSAYGPVLPPVDYGCCFTRYTDTIILGLQSFYNTTRTFSLEECLAVCLASNPTLGADCAALSFVPKSRSCSFYNVSARQQPAKFGMQYGSDYYEPTNRPGCVQSQPLTFYTKQVPTTTTVAPIIWVGTTKYSQLPPDETTSVTQAKKSSTQTTTTRTTVKTTTTSPGIIWVSPITQKPPNQVQGASTNPGGAQTGSGAGIKNRGEGAQRGTPSVPIAKVAPVTDHPSKLRDEAKKTDAGKRPLNLTRNFLSSSENINADLSISSPPFIAFSNASVITKVSSDGVGPSIALRNGSSMAQKNITDNFISSESNLPDLPEALFLLPAVNKSTGNIVTSAATVKDTELLQEIREYVYESYNSDDIPLLRNHSKEIVLNTIEALPVEYQYEEYVEQE